MNTISPTLGTSAHHTASASYQEAHKVAGMFEQLFVQQMVQGFRKVQVPGAEGGMFGDGPGADTYAQWFDQHMAAHLSEHGSIGIRAMLMRQFARLGEIEPGSHPEVHHVV